MSNTSQNSFRVAAPGLDTDLPEADSDEMTEPTAAELRALCEEKNEVFDASLTEKQARNRIAALKELD
ncbi:hypothetical protein ACERZ8_00600 [Tateyamaria armeniaca]|uniref:DUF3072 domain-containing protein n=1 Tax=Tateyamaria armeniaca TaxID=2518930 RepID=A0ABW8UTB7_9RHOB